jgi:hypothetical protein
VAVYRPGGGGSGEWPGVVGDYPIVRERKKLGEDEPEGGTHVDTRQTLEAEDLSVVPPGNISVFLIFLD